MIPLKKYLLVGLIGLIFVFTGFMARRYVALGLGSAPGSSGTGSSKAGDPSGSYDVLVLGMDARPGQEIGNTDVMMLIHVDPGSGRVAIMSVPRDTRVHWPGYGYAKINAGLLIYGPKKGPRMDLAMVNGLLGSHARYYVITNFNGFKDIVDALGGVNFYVPQNMYYIGGPNTHIDLHRGYQHLNGTEALEFVRFRHFALGDIGRTMDQQALLKAIIKQHLNLGTIFKLPALLPIIHRSVRTNMPGRLILDLIRRLASTPHDLVVSETLPGDFLTLDGISYWYVVPSRAPRFYRSLLAGKTHSYLDPAATAAIEAMTQQSSPSPPIRERTRIVPPPSVSTETSTYTPPTVPESSYTGLPASNPPGVITPSTGALPHQ